MPTLADQIDAVLPQTQCTRCGYPDCRAYAQAVAQNEAAINRCPPGGTAGVVRLAAVTGKPALPLDSACGLEGPLTVAVIDEAWCIGCTLCIKACPVDCIVGTHKQMHTVIEAHCTGCELCLPACPVDCISLDIVTPGQTGWQAWTAAQAEAARSRYLDRTQRHSPVRAEVSGTTERKQSVIEAVLARSRSQRAEKQ
jgi:Na+-translocating ferredoxin:NAD+ oxidoreductase subunit B